MATRFGIVHDGRRLEIEPEATWTGTVVRLYADGELTGEAEARGPRATLAGEGFEIAVRLAWHGMTISRAELSAGDGAPRALEPEPGSAAARRERFARQHPGLYAARHAAKGVARALAPLIGLGVLLGLLPHLSLPLPDLPRIDLPTLPLPALALPDLPDLPALPAWLAAVLAAAKLWGPILVGVVLGVREFRRRRRGRQPAGGGGPGSSSARRLSAASRSSHSDASWDIQRAVAPSRSGRTR